MKIEEIFNNKIIHIEIDGIVKLYEDKYDLSKTAKEVVRYMFKCKRAFPSKVARKLNVSCTHIRRIFNSFDFFEYEKGKQQHNKKFFKFNEKAFSLVGTIEVV